MSFLWTPDTLRAARRLYLEFGLSAAESARRLGTTRSALIAKAHRMGWADERDPALAQANLVRGNRLLARDRRPVLPPREPAPEPGELPATARPKPWMQRVPGECAFPVEGDSEAVVSCCAPCGAETYCGPHRSAMYQREPESRKRALERVAEWVDRMEQPYPHAARARQ